MSASSLAYPIHALIRATGDTADNAGDEELAAAAATGSTEHFAALVRRYSAAIYRVAYRIAGDQHEAEDIAQETFVKLFHALPQGRSDLPFKPWLYRMAINTAISHWRRAHTRHRFEDAAPASAPSDDTAEAAAARLDAQAAIDRLPLDQRQVVVLRAVEGLSFAEIAFILDIPEATARTWFHRAKGRLAAYLGRP